MTKDFVEASDQFQQVEKLESLRLEHRQYVVPSEARKEPIQPPPLGRAENQTTRSNDLCQVGPNRSPAAWNFDYVGLKITTIGASYRNRQRPQIDLYHRRGIRYGPRDRAAIQAEGMVRRRVRREHRRIAGARGGIGR